MKIIKIQGRFGISRILIGEKFQNVARHADPQTTIIIADVTVHGLYADGFPALKRILIEPGEAAKTLETISRIYRELLAQGADRTSFVLGIGGGVTCDVAGFAASTYMRGVRFGFIATSLLSQVDAGVGGKNGVNLDGYKNIIGTFQQPEFVICDPLLLKTLPPKEISNGFAEVIKHGMIGSPELLTVLEKKTEPALALDPALMVDLIHDSIRVKARFVRRDERETGDRKFLNFGHTCAHAIEKTYGLTHGEAVAIGMVFAARLSLKKGVLRRKSVLERLVRLLRGFHLPVSLENDSLPVFEAMVKDKKKAGDHIDFVLIKDVGQPCLQKIPLASLKEETFDLCQPA